MTEQGQGQSTTPEGGAEQGQEQERTFTQADLNKIAANEKRDGISSVLSRLGVETLEEAEQIVTTYNEAQAEAESDLEKLERENTTLKEREKAALKLADDRLIGAELRTALMGAGVPSDRLNDALALTDRSMLSVEQDGSVTGLDDAVKATLEPRSWLTEAQQQEQPPRRAADVSRQVAPTSSDPQQLHGQFLASLLGNNSP